MYQCEETSLAQLEKKTPPRNCQIRHVGCICVLLDSPSEQPDPIVLRSNILNITETTQEIKKYVPKNKTSKIYTSQASLPHLQGKKTESDIVYHTPGQYDTEPHKMNLHRIGR